MRQSRAFSASLGLSGLVLGAALCASACAHHQVSDDSSAAADDPANVMPANYRPDVLAAMHAYLNDPTGVREAGVAEPALKSVGYARHYVVCLRFNARKHGKEYAGTREVAAVFIAGRFDRFADQPREAKEICAGATYAPFPELEKLKR